MPRLEWGNPEDRVFETGISNAVLYVDGGTGVAWNGIVSIVEKSEGGEPRSLYYDGTKFKQRFTNENFEASIEAYTYPVAFEACEGVAKLHPGFRVGQQRKKSFGLCYKTLVGDGITEEKGYKLHLVYNAWAFDSEKSRQTKTDEVEALLFSWEVTTVPISVLGASPSAYFSLDSREIHPQALALVEDALYGSDTQLPRLLDPSEIIGLLASHVGDIAVTNHGDGTYTVEGDDTIVQLLGDGKFTIDSSELVTDGSIFTVSS